MSERTPGPCEPKAAQTPLSELVLFQEGFYGGKIKRCLIEYDDGSSRQIPANVMDEAGRLIAAAPDLLAALKQYVILGSGKCSIGKPCHEMARAAVAKAEGQ